MTGLWRQHLTRDVLPWWEQHGVVPDGVMTGFDNDGTLVSTDRFTWSQGRWAWVCAQLARDAQAGIVDADPVWTARCTATARWLLDVALRDDGRTHFRCRDDGTPVPDEHGQTATSVFADLFAVLGWAGCLSLDSLEEATRHRIETAAIDVLLHSEHSITAGTALSEPYPIPAGFTDLATPMMLLHVSSELAQAMPADNPTTTAVTDVTRRAAATLTTQHLRPGGSGWHELAVTDPTLADTLLARHRTPGHLLELVWMIRRATQAQPDLDLPDPTHLADLAHHAITTGWDPDHGGILRYTDHHGGPPTGRSIPGARYEQLIRTTWDTKLWWVHAEAMYALTLLAPHDPRLATWADRVVTWTMTTYPAPGHEWLQIRQRDGTPLNKVVALPVKDPFHITRCLILLNRLDTTPKAG